MSDVTHTPNGAAHAAGYLDDILTARDVLGVVRRDHPVRMLNVSGSGCLVEADTRIEPGTIAFLAVTANGREFSDSIRVVRCQPVAGGSSCQVAAEFIWTTHPGASALRRFASLLPSTAQDAEAPVPI